MKDEKGQNSQASVRIFKTILDANARMFGPFFTGILIGYFVDDMSKTFPIGLLTGSIIGLILGIFLVGQLYIKVKKK